MLLDVPVHDLSAGGQSLLQSSRNKSGASTSSSDHLNCRLRLKRGGRYLLLGKNGCGKTTLLQAVQRGLPGSQKLKTFLVDQELAFLSLESTSLEAVLSADSAASALQDRRAELERLLEAPGEDVEAAERASLELAGVYEALARREDEVVRVQRARSLLAGLGFSPERMQQRVHDLSGGWRMRTAVAAALFVEPELLMLDEPTNHLDVQATLWLQDYLIEHYAGNCTLLCVSHERSFINAVLTEIVVFEEKSLINFAGSLEEFEAAAEQFSKHLQREQETLEKKKEAAKAAIDVHVAREKRSSKNKASNIEHRKYGDAQALFYGSSQSSKVTALNRKLDRVGMEKTLDGKRFKASQHGCRLGSVDDNEGEGTGRLFAAAPLLQKKDPSVRFSFHDADNLGVVDGMPVLQLQEMTFGYPEHPVPALTSPVSISFSSKCRTAIVGPNGCGKSTLVNLILGSLEPTGGQVWRHRNLRIGHLNQHSADELQRLDSTPLDYLQELFPTRLEADLRALLGSFGLHGSMATQALQSLSGGQRMRLAFARICGERPHMLLLDEPTNHLDIYSIDALTDALQRFEGGVVLVTHNLSLLGAVTEEMVIVKEGSCSSVHVPEGSAETLLLQTLGSDVGGQHPEKPTKAHAEKPEKTEKATPKPPAVPTPHGKENQQSTKVQAQGTSSASLCVAEKEFLRCAKRMREMLRLEALKAAGSLDRTQEDKLKRKDEAERELREALRYLPSNSELPERNRDLLSEIVAIAET